MLAHDELETLAAAYALAAVGREERLTLETHLAGCPSCSRLVGEMTVVAGALPLSLGETQPPPAFRERLVGAVRATRAAEVGAQVVRFPQRRGWRRVLAPPALVAAILGLLLLSLVGGGFWIAGLQASLATAQARVDRTYEAVAIMGQAEEWWRVRGTEAAPDAAASLAYASRRSAACLLVWNLPKIQGKSYQAWAVKDGVTTSLGRMRNFDSNLWLIIPQDVKALEAVHVTLEESDAPQQPSGAAVLRVPIRR